MFCFFVVGLYVFLGWFGLLNRKVLIKFIRVNRGESIYRNRLDWDEEFLDGIMVL